MVPGAEAVGTQGKGQNDLPQVVGHTMVAGIGIPIESIHIQPDKRLSGMVGDGDRHGDGDYNLRSSAAGNLAMVFSPGPELRAVQIGA